MQALTVLLYLGLPAAILGSFFKSQDFLDNAKNVAQSAIENRISQYLPYSYTPSQGAYGKQLVYNTQLPGQYGVQQPIPAEYLRLNQRYAQQFSGEQSNEDQSNTQISPMRGLRRSNTKEYPSMWKTRPQTSSEERQEESIEYEYFLHPQDVRQQYKELYKQQQQYARQQQYKHQQQDQPQQNQPQQQYPQQQQPEQYYRQQQQYENQQQQDQLQQQYTQQQQYQNKQEQSQAQQQYPQLQQYQNQQQYLQQKQDQPQQQYSQQQQYQNKQQQSQAQQHYRQQQQDQSQQQYPQKQQYQNQQQQYRIYQLPQSVQQYHQQLFETQQQHRLQQQRLHSRRQQYTPQQQKLKELKQQDQQQNEEQYNEQQILSGSEEAQTWSRSAPASNMRQNVRNNNADVVAWKVVMAGEQQQESAEQSNGIEHILNDAYSTMKHFDNEYKENFHDSYVQAVEQNNEEVNMNATELLKKHGYPVEEHIVKTDDGYHLTVFRIPAKQRSNTQTKKNEVVFLMHGILGSADDWLIMGPGKSLAYLLSDAGYDVYIGNVRGNKYSRHHASKHAAQKDFWKFSNDEIALEDLPAMINHALQTSQQDRLTYVGHSQGATNILALLSTYPEYNNKVKMVAALAPMVYMSNTKSPFFKMIAPNSEMYERVAERLGSGEFAPQKEWMYYAGGELCEQAIGCKYVCSNTLFAMAGINPDHLNTSMIPMIMSRTPAGSSMRVMKQLGQGVASGKFARYDFGAQVNEQVYGTPQPPEYKMEKIDVPVAVYSSADDLVASPRDVQQLAQQLKHVAELYQVPEPYFTHTDFQYSKAAPELVYKKLINTMNKYNTSDKV